MLDRYTWYKGDGLFGLQQKLVQQLAPNNQHNQSDQHENNDTNDDLVRGHAITQMG